MKRNKQQLNSIETNLNNGAYQPFFFMLKEYDLSKVVFESHYFNLTDTERILLNGDFSFAYLREDKLRTINADTLSGKIITFDSFLEHFDLNVEADNIFKCGKYLSRIFRPSKYGAFYTDLDIYLNEDESRPPELTDGISLISQDLAEELGWSDAKTNMSAQITLLTDEGLIKGHCVVSDKIKSDIVLYGKDSYKQEVKLKSGYQYISIEPLKGSSHLRLDIQTLLNLWDLFGAEQYLQWAYEGIEEIKDIVLTGKLSKWLDNFDNIDEYQYESEKWILRKAIYHKIDYRQFPGLFKMAWSTLRSSIGNYGYDSNGRAVFKLHVPSGCRGYARVDLRDHDKHGNFISELEEGEVELDNYGNLWFCPNSVIDDLKILGGADQDDSIAIIPVEDNKSVLYRNPNQKGEYLIRNISGNRPKKEHKIVGSLEVKKAKLSRPKIDNSQTDNVLYRGLLNNHKKRTYILREYTREELVKSYFQIIRNSANIGITANAEMVLSAISIKDQNISSSLSDEFEWNLENVIDSTVKTGLNPIEDMTAVTGFFAKLSQLDIDLPEAIIDRIPSYERNGISFSNDNLLDQLLEAIDMIVKDADKEMLGYGLHSKKNRLPGIIDNLKIPVIELGKEIIDNNLYDIALKLLKDYNRNVAILIDKINDLEPEARESIMKLELDNIRKDLLKKMQIFTKNERRVIVQVFAYETYRSNNRIHDSILWINYQEELQGTASDMIDVIISLKQGCHINFQSEKERYTEYTPPKNAANVIRVWSKKEINVEDFKDAETIRIKDKKVLIGSYLFNLGDECNADEGTFKIKEVAQSISRKDNRKMLKNSVSVYL